MPLYSLDPREKFEDVNVFFSPENQCWYFRRAMDDTPIGRYESEQEALKAARRLSNLGHIHTQPCEKFESPYAENGPGVWHTFHLECIVCFWIGSAHSTPPEEQPVA